MPHTSVITTVYDGTGKLRAWQLRLAAAWSKQAISELHACHSQAQSSGSIAAGATSPEPSIAMKAASCSASMEGATGDGLR